MPGIALLVLAGLVVPAMAGNGAVVVKNPGCTWMETFLPSSQAVFNPDGFWKFTCKGTLSADQPTPPSAITYVTTCSSSWGYGVAKVTITPSRLVQITCQGTST